MTSDETNDLLAFTEIEPIGEDRMDVRFAYLYALHANINRGKDDKPFAPATFLEDFDFWKVPPTEEELRKQRLEGIKKAMRQIMADQKYVAEENARVLAAQSGRPPKGVVLGPDGQPVR